MINAEMTDIQTPEFRILHHKNNMILDRETAKFCRDGWYPCGGVGRKGNEWVQVIMREKGKGYGSQD